MRPLALVVIAGLAGCDIIWRIDVVPDAQPHPDGVTTDAPCTTFTAWSLPTALTANDVSVDNRDAALSPDGSYIVFVRGVGAASELFVSRRVGNDFGVAVIFDFNSAQQDSGPFFNSDGTVLYYTRGANKVQSTIGMTGSGPVFALPQLASEFSGFSYLERPRIGSSGLQMVYFAQPTAQLYLATRASTSSPWSGTAITELASPEVNDGPTLSGDELTMYWSSKRGGLPSRSLFYATRMSSQLQFGSAVAFDIGEPNPTAPDISRDGKTMVFTAYQSSLAMLYMATRECAE